MFWKRNLSLLCLCIFALSISSNGQDTAAVSKNPWKISILSSLTLTLNSYSDNWSGGEFSAFSWGSQFNGSAERSFTKWFSNKNTLKLAFGQTAIQKDDSTGNKEWQSLKKSSDLVDFESVAQFTLRSFVDPFISARVVTQFADMRVNDHKEFLNPLTLTESFGAMRDFIKGDRVTLTARLGGAVRQSIDRNYHLPDSLKPADDYTNDGGVEFVTDFKAASKDNRLSYISQIKIYEAIFSSSEDKMSGTSKENDWRYPDVAWENTLGVNLAKYIMLNLYAQLLYDREINNDLRYRETVGLALTYAFAN